MAPVITHKVVKLEEQPGNLPPYVWYGQCACGFASRMATKDLVESQLNAHLSTHGVAASNLSSAPVVVPDSNTGKTTGTWVPLGAKANKG